MIKYLENGQKVEVVESVKFGFLIKYYHDDYFDEEEEPQEHLTDDIYFVNQVFNSPPTESLHSEVKKLKEEISKLQEEESKILGTIRDEKNRIETQLEKLKKYKGLQLIEDYIDEKITHFVVLNYFDDCPEIIPAEEKLKHRESGEFKTRLLALYGDKNGDLEWQLHYYSDGSGSRETVYPFTSYGAAIKKVHEILAKLLKKIEKKRADGKIYFLHELVDTAEKYDFLIPGWAIEERANDKEEERLDKIAELEKRKVEADAEIKKLMKQ